jgi:hypothetical protein
MLCGKARRLCLAEVCMRPPCTPARPRQGALDFSAEVDADPSP